MKRVMVVVILLIMNSLAFAEISWMGNHSATQSNTSQEVTFYVEMYDSYYGCHAEVYINDNGWSNHTLFQGANNGNNSTWSANISVSSGNISYYFYGWDNWGAEVNDGSQDTSYSIIINPTTTANGNWNDSNNWCDASVPSSTTATYVIAHKLKLNQEVTVGSILINSGITFTASDGSKANRTLTIQDGGTLTNNGTFDAADGTVVFAGSGTVSGSVTFNNVEINGGVDFGSSSTINGNFTINSGGYANNNAPTYGSNSILIFNTGSSYTIDESTVLWTTGSTLGEGVPNNVTVNSTSPLNIYEARDVTGDLTINSSGSVEQGNNDFIVQGNMLNSGSYSFVSDGAKPLTVYGDFTNDSNGSMVLSNTIGGDLKVQGDFYDNGTFTANDRAVFLNGSSTQHLESTDAMDYLFINNSAGIILDSQLEINNDLDLTSGTIELGTNNLIINSSASISNSSSSSYVKTNDTGILTREAGGKADVLFPVGNSAYNPVRINNTGTTDNFSVKVADGTPSNINDETRVVNRTWTITEDTAGGSNATVTLQWNSNETGTNFDISNELVIGRYVGPGNNWETKSATSSGTDPYTAQTSGFTSFSDFTVASGGGSTLPVELSSFTAMLGENGPQLNWTTQSEENNAGWNVYRGETETAWQQQNVLQLNSAMGLIEGAGTTSEPTDYQFEDVMPTQSDNSYWYWLESVDYSGVTELYGPAMVQIPAQDPGFIETPDMPHAYGLQQNYPNPFNPSTEISFTLRQGGPVELSVYNLKGQLLRTLIAGETMSGNQQHSVVWDGKDQFGNEVTSGIYLYKLRTLEKVYSKKMLLVK